MRPADGMAPSGASPETSPPRPTADPPGPGETWTLLRLVLWSAQYLGDKGVDQGRLDAEHLLADTLGVARLQLYLQHDRPVTPAELQAFKPRLLRRAAREPLQHILGRAAFRELDLQVDGRVLIPRPETEVLVDLVLGWSRARAPDALTAVDVGTGSGCIALSLAREGPFPRVVATDVSAAALALAAANARRARLEERVDLREGDLLAPLGEERYDVLVSNPPYVAEGERAALAPEVRDFEPAAALFAGPDGLDVLRRLVAGGFETPAVRRDLTGRPRVVMAVARS